MGVAGELDVGAQLAQPLHGQAAGIDVDGTDPLRGVGHQGAQQRYAGDVLDALAAADLGVRDAQRDGQQHTDDQAADPAGGQPDGQAHGLHLGAVAGIVDQHGRRGGLAATAGGLQLGGDIDQLVGHGVGVALRGRRIRVGGGDIEQHR